MNNIIKQRGLTLVELVVTVAIVAILASAAAPSFRDMMERNRLSALNNQLVSAINYARGEAVKRVFNVVLCVRKSDGSDCTATATDGFEKGWLAFVDTNANGVLDSGETILLDEVPNVMPGLVVSSNISTAQKISYKPNGNVSNSGTLTLTLNSTNRYQVVLLSGTGRVRSCKVEPPATSC